MLQQSVVQHDHAGLRQSARVDAAVKDIVGDMVEMNIRPGWRQLHCSEGAQRGKQRSGMVGDSGSSGRQRRMESDAQSMLRRRQIEIVLLAMVRAIENF